MASISLRLVDSAGSSADVTVELTFHSSPHNVRAVVRQMRVGMRTVGAADGDAIHVFYPLERIRKFRATREVPAGTAALDTARSAIVLFLRDARLHGDVSPIGTFEVTEGLASLRGALGVVVTDVVDDLAELAQDSDAAEASAEAQAAEAES